MASLTALPKHHLFLNCTEKAIAYHAASTAITFSKNVVAEVAIALSTLHPTPTTVHLLKRVLPSASCLVRDRYRRLS